MFAFKRTEKCCRLCNTHLLEITAAKLYVRSFGKEMWFYYKQVDFTQSQSFVLSGLIHSHSHIRSHKPWDLSEHSLLCVTLRTRSTGCSARIVSLGFFLVLSFTPFRSGCYLAFLSHYFISAILSFGQNSWISQFSCFPYLGISWLQSCCSSSWHIFVRSVFTSYFFQWNHRSWSVATGTHLSL